MMDYSVTEFEKTMSESLDEMLVDNGLEKPRQHVVEHDSLITKQMGLLVTKRVDPRVTVTFDLLEDKPLESSFTVTYQNCSCRFKIVDCSMISPEHHKKKEIKPIIKIKTFIKQMWRNYQHVFFQLLDELYGPETDKINKILAEQQKNR